MTCLVCQIFARHNTLCLATTRPHMTQILDARTLTHIDRIDFLRGWQSVKGYVGDIDTAQPWCKPWTWDDPIITVDGVTPEQWGASHCERHRRDIEDEWNRRARADDYRRRILPRSAANSTQDAPPDDDSEKLAIFDRLRPYDALQWLSDFADVFELIYDRTVMTFSVNLTYKSDGRFVTRIVQEPVNGCVSCSRSNSVSLKSRRTRWSGGAVIFGHYDQFCSSPKRLARPNHSD